MNFAVTKRIDRLGRILIPKELRNFYGLDENDTLRLVATDSGILLVKERTDESSIKRN